MSASNFVRCTAPTGRTTTVLEPSAVHAANDGSAADSCEGVDAELIEVATAVVHRLFGVGLTLHAASCVADAETAVRLQAVVDELDALIDDVRLIVFSKKSVDTTNGRPTAAMDVDPVWSVPHRRSS